MAFEQASHFGKTEAIRRDLKTPFSVVGHRFWYFGENAPALPSSLKESKISLPDAYRRGHRVITETHEIEEFMHWLDQWPEGVHGKPRDLPPIKGFS